MPTERSITWLYHTGLNRNGFSLPPDLLRGASGPVAGLIMLASLSFLLGQAGTGARLTPSASSQTARVSIYSFARRLQEKVQLVSLASWGRAGILSLLPPGSLLNDSKEGEISSSRCPGKEDLGGTQQGQASWSSGVDMTSCAITSLPQTQLAQAKVPV